MSGLKRSSSCSNIPLPKVNVPSRSKSTSRVGLKDNTDKRGRLVSLARPAIPKLTCNSSGYKKVSATPTSSRISLKKKTPQSDICAPSTSSAGSERKVNDPEWVSEQFSKVRDFLQQHPNCPEQVLTSLKPMKINSFVYVMNLLLKEIDPECKITTTNYKSLVLSHLKTLHYPGPLSTSLLKTVNKNYVWPKIISIFSWLVDLITFIRRVDLPVNPKLKADPRYKKMEYLTDYFIKKFEMFNNNEDTKAGDAKSVSNFSAILNMDIPDSKELAKEVETLRVAKENKLQSIAKLETQNAETKNNIELLNNEISQFYSNKGKNIAELKAKIEALKEKRAKLTEKVKSGREATMCLLELIKIQPCTGNEKRRMRKHIKELKETIDLKREKLKLQKEQFCEERLVEAKKKIEIECTRINNELTKLVDLEPKLKVLRMKEGYSNKNELQNDVENLMENFKVFETNLNSELSNLKFKMTHMDEKLDLILKQKDLATKCAKELKLGQKTVANKIKQLNLAMENMLKTKQENKRIFDEKMEEFKKIENEYIEVHKQYEEAKQKKENREASFEKLKSDCKTYFSKLNDIMMQNSTEMEGVYDEMEAFFKECVEKVKEYQ